MITKQELNEQIESYCRELRLPAIRQSFAEGVREANKNSYSYEEFLYYLLQKQSDLRRENGRKNRIRLANFPSKKYIELTFRTLSFANKCLRRPFFKTAMVVM